MNWKKSGPSTHKCPLLRQQPSPFQQPSPICHSERSEDLRCASIPPQFLRATILPIPTEPICLRPHFVHEERLTCLWASQRWNELEDIGSLRHTVLSLGNSPLPFNNPL